jgi:hypothetical protein
VDPPERGLKVPDGPGADALGMHEVQGGEGARQGQVQPDVEPEVAPVAPEAADLLSNAIALPARERARIAHQLLLSLDEGADADGAQAWIAQLERLAPEVRSRSVATEKWATVKARLAERWRRR